MKKVLVLGLLICAAVYAAQEAPEVTLKQGTLRGSYRKTWKGKSFNAFTGIPYAKPPVGDLRFKVAVPAEPWEGVLDTSKSQAICPQIDIFFSPNAVSGDEDCLYLNVYSPQLTEPNKDRLPVMVFIHGGGFQSGTGNSNLNGPDILLDKDVLLVTINYRLGALGFLSTGDEVMPGNNGLKDQNLALKWVKDNIAHFGGDPQRITIFGQSAGGSSVHYHMLSPLSKGLFFAAIAHSGVSTVTWAFAPKSQALRNAKRLGEFLNCPTNSSREMVDCLKKVDAYDIVRQDPKFLEWNYDPCIPFKPVIEPNITGAFLTEDPVDIVKSGNFADIPFMSGITTDDGALESATIYNHSHLVEELNQNFTRIAPLIFQYDESVPNQEHITMKIREFYFRNHEIDNSTRSEATDMMTDNWFLAPQNFVTQLHAQHSKQPVYVYLFGYHGSISYGPFYGDPSHDYGVVHCDDLIYLLSTNLFDNYKPSETDWKMNDVMTTLWTNFARTGNPTPEADQTALNKWKPIQGGSLENLEFYSIKSHNNIKMIKNPYVDRSKFWDNLPIYPKEK